MAFDSFIVEDWIYDTLNADSTLHSLLATLADKAPNFQGGIYTHLAPQIDAISMKPPIVPYIVITRLPGADDEKGMCGTAAFTYPRFRVLVWFAQSGSVSMTRIKSIADRVDTLLNNVEVTTTSPVFNIMRDGTEQMIQVEEDGRVYYAMIINYSAVTRH